MANYSMQSAKLPRKVCDSIDKKSRRFLWGGSEEKNSVHLLSWETIQEPKSLGGLGITSARQANAAFLTKLGWRTLAEPNSLWSRVLRSKYCSGRCDIDMFQPKQNMSNVWAGISSQAKTIIRGTATAVCNGRRTLFWDHSWVDGACLSDFAIAPIPDDLLGATVSDMWCPEYGWKWEIFSDFLPQSALQKIASISLVPDPDQEDSLYWNGTSSGRFSLKSALGFLQGKDATPASEPLVWRTIWRLPIQQKVKMFLWLATHGRLMVNVNRVRRNMSNNPLCPRCNTDEETTEHLLRSCHVSKQIWSLLGIRHHHSSFFNCPFSVWLEKNASNDVNATVENWPLQFALTCWWIWRWRNNIVFGKDSDNPLDPQAFLFHQFSVTQAAFDKFNFLLPKPGMSKQEVFIRWYPPPHGWILLNTDGASKGNPSPARSGGILRDESGNFLNAFYFSCGVCSSMKAELLALLAGLERAKQLNIDKLLICMDNKPCIQLINEDQLVSNSLKFIVKRCKDLIAGGSWTVKLEHCFREANRASDWLTNRGINTSIDVTYLDFPPNELRPILREDVFGVAIPRVIANI